jgi:hypothetical protein
MPYTILFILFILSKTEYATGAQRRHTLDRVIVGPAATSISIRSICLFLRRLYYILVINQLAMAFTMLGATSYKTSQPLP